MWTWISIALLLTWALTVTVLYMRVDKCNQTEKAQPRRETLHPLHQTSFEEQLVYWKIHIPDWSAIHDDVYQCVAILEFRKGRVTCLNDTNPSVHQDDLRWFINYITPLANAHPEWSGRIFVHSPDSPLLVQDCKFPVISWNIRIPLWGKGQLLGVDPYFMKDAHDHSFPEDDMQPFSEKKSLLNFRGNTTHPKRTWTIEKYFDHPDMDVKFTTAHVQDVRLMEKHPEMFEEFMDVKTQRNYKYLVNIDGYGAAWNRTEWQLRSNCIMFLDTQYYMFTSKHLKPWIHYVPISITNVDETDDLPTNLQIVKNLNHDQAQLICQQARTYAKSLNSTTQAWLYTETLIEQALSIYRQHPQETSV